MLRLPCNWIADWPFSPADISLAVADAVKNSSITEQEAIKWSHWLILYRAERNYSGLLQSELPTKLSRLAAAPYPLYEKKRKKEEKTPFVGVG